MQRWIPLSIAAGIVALAAGAATAQTAGAGHGEERFNTRLVGMNDLQARSAYQPLPVRQGERRIAYVGHHAGERLNPLTGAVEPNGTSVVDVTDPAAPVYLAHIPATGGASGAQMVQVCGGDRLPGGGRRPLLPAAVERQPQPRGLGRHRPGQPRLRAHGGRDGPDAHGRAAHPQELVGVRHRRRLPRRHRRRLARAAHPAGLRSRRPGRTAADPRLQPARRPAGRERPIPGGSGVHEAVRLGNRVYLAYGTSNNGAVQILDRDRLLNGDPDAAAPLGASPASLAYPQIGRIDLPSFWGGHTAMPLLGVEIADYAGNRDHATRDFLFVVSESVANACQETRHVTLMLDITDEAHPLPIGTFQVPESSGDFCDRGGRFGPHAPQWSMEPPFYGKLMVVSWFNAGARVIDVRDPFDMREVAYYIPATTERTDERCATIDGVEDCRVAIQTNNVEVDDRGLIYLADRADTGLHVVELTGAAAAVIDPGE